MPQKDKNVLGMVVLVAVFGVAFFLINPMFRYSFSRVFMHDFLGMELMQLPHAVMFSENNMMRVLPLMVMFVFWAAVTVWVFRDAESRGQNGLLWGLLVFFGNILGLIIYLIVRSTSSSAPPAAYSPGVTICPSCEKPVHSSYSNCPYCGLTLGAKCSKCGRSVELDWRVCAYCGKGLAR